MATAIHDVRLDHAVRPDARTLQQKQRSENISQMVSQTYSWHRSCKTCWAKQLITHLEKGDQRLKAASPKNALQTRCDHIWRAFEAATSFGTLNSWIDQASPGAWYRALAEYVCKLPLKVGRNIMRLLYNIVNGIRFAAVHPARSCIYLGRLLVRLADALAQPGTWATMGAGIIGAGLGAALVTGSPISLISMIIGSALLGSGLSVGALKAAVQAVRGKRFAAAQTNVLSQCKRLPESFLTGFVLGVLFGAIHKFACSKSSKAAYDHVQSYVQKQHLPTPSHIAVDSRGFVTMTWTGEELTSLQHHASYLFDALKNTCEIDALGNTCGIVEFPTSVSITGQTATIHVHHCSVLGSEEITYIASLRVQQLAPLLYTPPDAAITTLGATPSFQKLFKHTKAPKPRRPNTSSRREHHRAVLPTGTTTNFSDSDTVTK